MIQLFRDVKIPFGGPYKVFKHRLGADNECVYR